jgi:hypothetical protein
MYFLYKTMLSPLASSSASSLLVPSLAPPPPPPSSIVFFWGFFWGGFSQGFESTAPLLQGKGRQKQHSLNHSPDSDVSSSSLSWWSLWVVEIV